MAENLKSKVVKGAFWALLTKFSMRMLTFVVTLVLARLLTPSDYGVISLLTIFISVASTFAESGFGKALIQKKDVTEVDFNSMFYTSIALACIVYGILFCSAPFIAEFYRDTRLVWLMRVLSLSIVLHSISAVQSAELSREMRFDIGFKVSAVSHIFSSFIGITLAMFGCGPWAIVWSQLSAGISGIVVLWFCIKWRPQLIFSWKSVRELWGFGWKLTVSSLLDTVYRNLYGFLVGRIYTKEDLAFVDKGYALPALAMDTISGPLNSVMYPALAKLQDDRDRFRIGMRRLIKVSTFLVFPVLTGVAVCARPITLMMYGDQWIESIPYVQLACFSFALYPMHVINLHAISALGRSDIYLKLEIIKKVLGVMMVLISIRHGVFCLMATLAFVNGPLGLIVNMWPNRKLLGYTILMQLYDVFPTILVSAIMAGSVLLVDVFIHLGLIASLFVQISFGVVVFAICVWVGRFDSVCEIVEMCEPFSRKITSKIFHRLYQKVAHHFALRR